jgi:hypothetical protein
MRGRRRAFRQDETAVSEVIGYILSFAISFMILVASMATFSIIAEQGDRLAAAAEMRDVSNRVAASVLHAFEVGSNVRATQGDVDSSVVTPLVYGRSLDIPQQVQGFTFGLEIDSRYVYANSTDGSIRVNSTTFKADIVLAPAGTCTAAYVVCRLGGAVPPGSSQAVVTYMYDASGIPLVNEITIG